MSTPKDKSQRRKAMYSEEFQEMLDRLEEEDNVDRSGNLGMKKSRLCLEKVKALEKHFEVENKLQPERKVRIAEEVGLEPRQVAVWFQNRRARWKTKHLEREYDHLRASYDALKLDYGSLEQEKVNLLNQLEDLKAKIEATSVQESSSTTIPPYSLHSTDASGDRTSISVPATTMSSTSFSSSRIDQIPVSSSPLSTDEFKLCKAYQDQLMRMDELGLLQSNESCNFFSVDQAPTLNWHHSSD